MVTGRGISLASKNSIAYRKRCAVQVKKNVKGGDNYHLFNREKLEKFLREKVIVSIIVCNVCEKLFNILRA